MKMVSVGLIFLFSAIAISGCGAEFNRARWERILPGSTEPQRVIEAPTHCEVAKSAGRPCLEPAVANVPD